MFIELTTIDKEKITLKIEAIDSINQGGGKTSVSVGDSTYYVRESYDEVRNLIKKEIENNRSW